MMAINWRQEVDKIINTDGIFDRLDEITNKIEIEADKTPLFNPNQETGSGIKPEGETPEEKNEVLKYLISSQHPDLRAYFVLDKDGFIRKNEIVKGKQAVENEVYKETDKFKPADILAFDDLYTLVTDSIPYKIAIHERAPWMFPIQQDLPPFVNGGGLSGMFKNLTGDMMLSPAQVAKKAAKSECLRSAVPTICH